MPDATDVPRYDRTIIMEHATNLYARADSTVRSFTMMGGIFGACIAFVGASIVGSVPDGAALRIAALIPFPLLLLIGFYIGRGRAFQYRLMAQTALCQAQIEANTAALLAK